MIMLNDKAKIKYLDFTKRSFNSDNSNRRSGVDRRQYSYTLHIPERRGGGDRRNDEDPVQRQGDRDEKTPD